MKGLIHTLFGWRWPYLGRWAWYRRWQGIPESKPWGAAQTKEALDILERTLTFAESINREYEYQWLPAGGNVIKIQRPRRYTKQGLE